ncbi:uncharacterized protein LOC134267319 [Saccostrea cucullata]|uniref:uncharacterized protein LOC134267319 n=1 Tax=Saccostrea cuccullata TaxID=36930 RepID=UPI002ED13EF4
MDLNLNVNECFISGDAELMLKRSCGQECLVFQDMNTFRHSTPKEAASRFHGKHESVLQTGLFSQSKSKEDICVKKVKCTHEFLQRRKEEIIHSTPKFNNDLTNILSEKSKNQETLRAIKKPGHRAVLKTARILHRTPKEHGNKLLTRCQAILKEGDFCHSTPKEIEIQSQTKYDVFAEKGKIRHSTPKEATDVIEEVDEDMLWTGASAKVIQRAISAPQLPGNSEFDSNNLHRVMSLPHLWIPRQSTQVQHWQRRLEVLNRKTEKMRQKDKALKDRLERIQKRADLLTSSPIPTPVKEPQSRTACLNKYFYNYNARSNTMRNVPKIKKRVVHHPNNVYSCTLGNLIIGRSELHTYWKNGQKCTYV